MATTKKLSDIGTLITPITSSPNSVTQFEPFVQMTLEERRELVRAVWDAGFYACCYRPYSAPGYAYEAFNEFLKEEGL